MTPDELRDLIALGREQRHVEFKGAGSRNDAQLRAKVIRAILSMANNRDGGVVILGVNDGPNDTAIPVGLSASDASTWNYDDLHSNVSNHADPYVDCSPELVDLDGKLFVAIRVQPFDDIPVLCKRALDPVLRNGALYVRRHGKNETIEVPSHVEMREVLEQAAMIKAKKIVRQSRELFSDVGRATYTEPPERRFDLEAKDMM